MGVLLALAFHVCRGGGVGDHDGYAENHHHQNDCGDVSWSSSLILSWSDDYAVLDDGRVNGRSDDALDANVLNGDVFFSWNVNANPSPWHGLNLWQSPKRTSNQG